MKWSEILFNYCRKSLFVFPDMIIDSTFIAIDLWNDSLILFVCLKAVDFFNQINMLYGTITEFCTEESCPLMSAGPKYEYHWADGQTVKKPIKCSAPKYIDYLMTWVQDQLDDESLFPSKIGNTFESMIR